MGETQRQRPPQTPDIIAAAGERMRRKQPAGSAVPTFQRWNGEQQGARQAR